MFPEFDSSKPVQCPKCGTDQENYVQKQMVVVTKFKAGEVEEIWHFVCDNCKFMWKMREREINNEK